MSVRGVCLRVCVYACACVCVCVCCCFSDFLSEYISTTPGFFRDHNTQEIVGVSGFVALVTPSQCVFVHANPRFAMRGLASAGKHQGCELYTVGQSAKISGAVQRWIVVSKSPSTGDVGVVQGDDNPALFSTSLQVCVCFL